MVIFPTRQPETNTVTSPGYLTSPAPCGQLQSPLCSIPQVSDLPRGTRGRGGAGSVSRTGIPTPEKEVPSTAPHSSVQEEILKLAGQDGGLPKRVRHLLQAGWSPSCLLFNSWCCVCHSLVSFQDSGESDQGGWYYHRRDEGLFCPDFHNYKVWMPASWTSSWTRTPAL